jgi:Methyltransferase domain
MKNTLREKSMLQDIYNDGTYLQNNPDWHLEESGWKAEEISRLMELHKLKPASVVEVGCGAGGILSNLAKTMPGVKFEGFDVAPYLTEVWPKFSASNLSFQLNDFLEVNNSYDVALLLDVFEHVPDYVGFLKGISHKSKYFIFNIPLDMYALGIIFDYQMQTRKSVGHLHYFSKATAIATLEECGYSVLGCSFKPYMFLGKKGGRKVLNFCRKVLYTASPNLNAKILGGSSLFVVAQVAK